MTDHVLTLDCAHSSLQLPTGEIVLFDSVDAPLVARYTWFNNGKGYACAQIRVAKGKRVMTGMHRLIMGFPNSVVDHINRNKLDNRRSNLRSCTQRENILNQDFNWAKKKNCSSKYKGVSRRGDKWQVVIREREGKLKWMGTYATEDEANAIASKHFLPYKMLE